jgi:predicted nucleotide-binding protein
MVQAPAEAQTYMPTTEEIISQIDELRNELKSFLKSSNFGQISEQIDRWTNRAHTLLAECGLPDDANRLSGASHGIRMNDLRGNVLRKANARDVVLAALRNDMHAHPNFYQGKLRQTLVAKQPAPHEELKTRIFLGHGRNSLWAKVQLHLQNDLGLETEAWESESRSGNHVIDVLKKMLASCGFAVIVAVGEDTLDSGIKRARPNVIHEIGLFQGRIGFEKVAVLIQEGVEGFSNIEGLQRIYFPQERIETAFYELDRMLKREGY